MLNKFTFVVTFRIQVERHVVDGLFRPTAEPNTLLHHILAGFRNTVFRHASQRRHQLGNVNVGEFLRFFTVDKDFEGHVRLMLNQSRRIFEHGLVPSLVILDQHNLVQSLHIILLVDKVNDKFVIGFDVFREFDTLIDLAVHLEHLENGVLVDNIFIVLEEALQFLFSLFHCLIEILHVFLAHWSALGYKLGHIVCHLHLHDVYVG